jgi:hypothetical protein
VCDAPILEHCTFVDTPGVLSGEKQVQCGSQSGSGWVAVVPLDRGDQGGSNGSRYNVAVAVLSEFGRVETTPLF